ncbi:MAG: ABC transporter permease [Bacteroidota bacterium]
MIRNYLKTALRNLRKNKLYSAINILGLTAGLTACLLIGIYITHELSYDKFHANAGRIVRATMEYSRAGDVSTAATTGTKTGPQFKRTFLLWKNMCALYRHKGGKKGRIRFLKRAVSFYADEAFFKALLFHW